MSTDTPRTDAIENKFLFEHPARSNESAYIYSLSRQLERELAAEQGGDGQGVAGRPREIGHPAPDHRGDREHQEGDHGHSDADPPQHDRPRHGALAAQGPVGLPDPLPRQIGDRQCGERDGEAPQEPDHRQQQAGGQPGLLAVALAVGQPCGGDRAGARSR